VTQDPHAIDSYANGLLTIAIKDLKEDRILRAHIISKGLCDVDFFRRGEAKVIEATASMHMHPSSVYEKSAKKFKDITDDSDLQDATIPRGAAYLGLAWAKIGLEDYSAASWAAEEAAKVFTKIGANPELGDAIYVQGLLEVPKGNLEGALKMFRRSSTFNAINPTRALRVSHDGFEDSLERLFEAKSFDSETRALVAATS
jgi:tetratricopeptide (TPR) repeat protein